MRHESMRLVATDGLRIDETNVRIVEVVFGRAEGPEVEVLLLDELSYLALALFASLASEPDRLLWCAVMHAALARQQNRLVAHVPSAHPDGG
jgi:hypothetical protein